MNLSPTAVYPFRRVKNQNPAARQIYAHVWPHFFMLV